MPGYASIGIAFLIGTIRRPLRCGKRGHRKYRFGSGHRSIDVARDYRLDKFLFWRRLHVYIGNGQGAILNRVTGPKLSLIEGQLKASGSVYLINPQGIVVGPHGTIATCSMVLLQDSSTGQQVFVDTGSKGTVSNVGGAGPHKISLQAADGNVYALAGRNSALAPTAPQPGAEICGW